MLQRYCKMSLFPWKRKKLNDSICNCDLVILQYVNFFITTKWKVTSDFFTYKKERKVEIVAIYFFSHKT